MKFEIKQGHVIEVLKEMPAASVPPRDAKGRFIKGYNYNPNGRFKAGSQKRWPRKPHWDKQWLYKEYVAEKRSMLDIAKECGVTENAIQNMVTKLGIPTRSTSEIRAMKHWGQSGSNNPMYGRFGPANPNYKGGAGLPYRQHLYSRPAWRRLRREVLTRDGGCRRCGSRTALQLHHIEPMYSAPLLATDPNNVICLCRRCHKQVTNNEKWWRKRLFALLRERD